MATRKKKRNYRAEYKRRIERALKKGYSRSVARGHPKRKTVSYVDSTGAKRKKTIPVELGVKGAKFLGEKPGANIQDIIERDMRYAFGKGARVKREKGEGVSAYVLRLNELMKNSDSVFNWENEGEFIEQMKAIGMTEHEAYSALFGSP